MPQKAQATSVALIYRFFLISLENFLDCFEMFCLHFLLKKNPIPGSNLIYFQGMRFMLNDSSIQKKEVKLENGRNGYFFVFTVLMNTSWNQHLMINI